MMVPLVGFSQQVRTQNPIPKREVRAVWITTLLGLDWPKSMNKLEQQKSLSDIVRNLKAANFNTIYFQVRGRGDAMYHSTREPWSQQLTGTLGKDPGWDPLEFIIREAHAQDMEVHAWFNTFLVKNGREKPPASQPMHPVLQHPDWARRVGDDWWLDPGLPAVREYLLNTALEIVRTYDVDGFQFDFIRYPGTSFPDDATFRRYGGNRSKEDWRRENVTALLSSFYAAATAVKPMMKIGATTLGIYKNSSAGKGLQSYYEVYQDSRGWLEKGILDYLAPQIYWSLGEKQGNPDFAAMAAEWSQFSYGKQIVLGIGPYKPEVASQLGEIIDVSRSANVSGHAFFRYANIEHQLSDWRYYNRPAFTPPMAWKDAVPPNAPEKFRVVSVTENIKRLEWQSPLRGKDGDQATNINIYRSSSFPFDTLSAMNLIAILPSSTTRFLDTLSLSQSDPVYAISALDKRNNESTIVLQPGTFPPALAELLKKFSPVFKFGKGVMRDGALFIPYEIKVSTAVRITLADQYNNILTTVVDDFLDPGRYVAAANTSSLKRGIYTVRVNAGSVNEQQSIRVGE
jgi:uncharacterized lipoprotein YddW (UPF0748 family)